VQEFTAISVKKGDKLDTAVKAAYKIKPNVSTALTFNQLGKVSFNAGNLALPTPLPKDVTTFVHLITTFEHTTNGLIIM